MTLDEYLSKAMKGRKKMADADFGATVGLSQSHISRLRRGAAKPSWRAMAAIEQATNGKVKLADWTREVRA